MSRKYWFGFLAVVLVSLILGVVYASTQYVAVLHPKGAIGLKERDLIITSTLLMLIVVIPVIILTFFIVWRYQDGSKNAHYDPNWNDNFLIETIWWGLPFVIIIFLSLMAWRATYALDPYKPLESDHKPLTIQVVALEWKWLFIYPEHEIATVNFIQFPEKIPINFEIAANAPMNSFWIPQLGGQIYAMPGMKTKLHLIADESGTFRGSSANLSGKGFAGMVFDVKASAMGDFDKWVETVKQSPNNLDLELYKQLAEPSEYNPVTTYMLGKKDLFDWIVMEAMKRPGKKT